MCILYITMYIHNTVHIIYIIYGWLSHPWNRSLLVIGDYYSVSRVKDEQRLKPPTSIVYSPCIIDIHLISTSKWNVWEEQIQIFFISQTLWKTEKSMPKQLWSEAWYPPDQQPVVNKNSKWTWRFSVGQLESSWGHQSNRFVVCSNRQFYVYT